MENVRSLIDILELSTQEIDELVEVGTKIIEDPAAYAHKCDGKILATPVSYTHLRAHET